ncbi:hypothetical protein [Saccharopolyspora phatthalungensis]|uniref:hypothetical protein n=1 Tax=Saccharopolyspora phatthalungensis TaxID=664693 RepID=UPI000A44BDE2|nr:hypothetical protein [Saccharopolyspora phatthalungensis]
MLATLEVPDKAQLRARLAELTCPDGVEPQPANTYEARDPSGFIIVTVDKFWMVTNVQIRSRWNDHIRPDAFPAALYNTYVTAVQRALAVELTHRPASPPSAPAPDDTYVDPTELSLEEWVAQTRSRLNAIDDEYDAIRRRQQAPQEGVTEIRSPLGYLTMQMRGGGPIAINGNPQALDHPSDTVLSEDILQLFVRASLGAAPGERSRSAQLHSNSSSDADDEYFADFNIFEDWHD